MRAPVVDLAAFAGRVDAVLAALAQRDAQGVLFVAGDDTEVAALAELVALARASDGVDVGVQFGIDAGDAGEGLLGRLSRECMGFMRGVWRDLTHTAVVDTGGRLHTRIGWTGDTICVVGDGGLTAARAHCASVQARVSTSVRRLRLLSIIAAAAGKIAGLIATPGAAVMALPVAYKCVRDMYEQWTAAGSNAGPQEDIWQ